MQRVPSKRPFRRSRTRRGATIVEFALVIGICLMFLFGIFEYGRFLFTLHVFNNAAREGARYAVSHTAAMTIAGSTTGNATSDVTNVVNQNLSGQTLASQNIQVYRSDITGNSNLGTWSNAQFGQYICVRITGNFRPVTPAMILLPNNIPVRAQSIMRSEAN